MEFSGLRCQKLSTYL